jgi:hypothetical protein
MEERPSASRTAAGFLLAPIIPCIVFASILSGMANQWNSLWFGAVAMIVVSELLSLVVALPLYLVLRRFRNVGPLECALAGVVIAVVLNAISLFFSGGSGYSAGDSGGETIVNGHVTAHGYVSDMLSTAFQSVLGVAIALTFWFIAIRSRRS